MDIVDTQDNIERLLAEINGMIESGLVTTAETAMRSVTTFPIHMLN